MCGHSHESLAKVWDAYAQTDTIRDLPESNCYEDESRTEETEAQQLRETRVSYQPAWRDLVRSMGIQVKYKQCMP